MFGQMFLILSRKNAVLIMDEIRLRWFITRIMIIPGYFHAIATYKGET